MREDPVIILTREEGDNQPLMDELEPMGFACLSYPCIETRLLPFHPVVSLAGKALEDFAAVVFTSRRGVTGCRPIWEQLKSSPVLAAVVGDSTAVSFRRHIGWEPGIIASPPTSEGLARELISLLPKGSEVIHFRGNKSTGVFETLMTENGFPVTNVVVYSNTTPVLKPLEGIQRGVVVFASPSAVKGFFKYNPHWKNEPHHQHHHHYLAIGPTTARYLREINVSPIIEANSPNPKDLIQKIKSLNINKSFAGSPEGLLFKKAPLAAGGIIGDKYEN